MNAIITQKAKRATSNFMARAVYAIALTAVTLPLAFGQGNPKPNIPPVKKHTRQQVRNMYQQLLDRREAEALRKWKASGQYREQQLLEGQALLRAVEHASKMPATSFKGGIKSQGGSTSSLRIDLGNVNDTKWKSVGPFGSQVEFESALGLAGSIVAGRTNAVAYDPRNAGIVYAATAGGGLWRRNEADRTPMTETYPWRPLGDKFPSLATYAVTVSPFNSKVVLVGTGAGIQRSTNGGNTFVSVGTILGRVTKILVDPDNANTLYAASTGQGISVSTDLGNTWTPIAPPTRFDTTLPPAGPRQIGEEWNDIEFSMADEATGERYMYATSRRGGLYRSLDHGATWELVNAPLVYNPINLNGPDPYAGGYGIEIAVSATDPYTLYVMDSSEFFDDGKLFVSQDAGDTWTEISGNYPATEGPSNNWSLATTSLAMIAMPVFLPGDTGALIATDALLGGTRRTASTEFSALQPASYPGRDWSTVNLTHIDQHDYSYTPVNPNRIMVANNGGIYEMTYDTASRSWAFTANALNRNLVATEFYNASFHPTRTGFAIGGTIANGVTRSQGLINDWRQLQLIFAVIDFNDNLEQFSFLNLLVELFTLEDEPGAADNDILPDETIFPGISVGSVAYDPTNSNGNTQYIMDHAGSGGKIYVTRNNWATGWEITPNRIVHNVSQFPITSNGASIFVFPQVNGQAATTANNWDGETRRPQGILTVDPFGNDLGQGGILYTGGNYLWRYDLQPGIAKIVNPANVDRGLWRRVGDVNLADEAGDYITAIAVGGGGGRVYVGTHLGKVWMLRGARNNDNATPIPALTGQWVRVDNPTLPSRIDPPAPQPPIRREITSISVNPNNPSSDILVGVAEAGIYRTANTLGTNFLFTSQNGSGVTALPGSTIRAIVRDTVSSGTGDADNSWFVGTATGVYATNNQGTTWTDATVPLGLPQAPIASMELNRNTGFLNVATTGRGAWQFDLRNATEQVVAPKLAIKYALSRNAGTIYGNITVENSGGQARNVQITGATLITNTQTTNATTINPANLGTIGTGPSSSRSLTATWLGTAGKRGEVVTLRIDGTYAGGGSFGLNVRTRLP